MKQPDETKIIIIKPVSSLCNLRCRYCYNSAEFQHRSKPPSMALDTAEALHRSLIDLGSKKVKLIWHGGEPLLRGIDFFRAVVAIQRDLLLELPDLTLENSIMTNATLMTNEWAAFFKENNWRVGVSLDGPAHVHNKYRVDAKGKGTFDTVLEGIRTVQNAGLSVGLIAVVTSHTVKHQPSEVYEFLSSESRNFDLLPCWEAPWEERTAEYVVEPQAFLEFMKSIFDIWWEEDNPEDNIRLFRSLIQGTIGGRPRSCAFNGNCSQFIAVDSNGSVYPCGKFAGIPEFYLGDINTQALIEILNSQACLEYLQIANHVPDKCLACSWFSVCHNGCTYDRYMGNGQFMEVSPFCETWRAAYEYVDGRVQETMKRLECG